MMRQFLASIVEHNAKHTVAVLVLPCESRILDVEDHVLVLGSEAAWQHQRKDLEHGIRVTHGDGLQLPHGQRSALREGLFTKAHGLRFCCLRVGRLDALRNEYV